MTPKKIAALGIAIALGLAGVVGVAVVNPIGGVGAAPGDDPGTTTDPAATSTDGGDAAPDGTSIVVEGEELTLDAAADQTIRGTSDLAAGTELTVRIRSTGENPFLYSSDATVGEDGTFTATFDLSRVPDDVEFEVAVIHDDEEVATANGVVSA